MSNPTSSTNSGPASDASNPDWISAEDYKWAQDHLTIACVDVVPVRHAADGKTITHVGLIYRDTPHQGKRWCLVGGRMRRNETLAEAAARQIRETLGPAATFHVEPDPQPDYTSQYFTEPKAIGLLDPRQHSLALVFVVAVGGVLNASGEAFEFRWFERDKLPPANEWGFDQNRVADACLKTTAAHQAP